MEIKIKKELFLKELQRAQGIVERKTTMPILSNVLLEAKENHLVTTATDLEVGIKTTAFCDVLSEGSVTVHAHGLFEIIKELPNATILLKVQENHWIEIFCERSDFKVMGLAPDEFPKLPQKGSGAAFNLDAAMVVEMIFKTAFAMSNDETRYNLNGVLLEPKSEKGEGLRMVATDGHRISVADREISGLPELKQGVILPRKGVLELKRLLEGKEGIFELWIGEKHIVAQKGETTLTCRLIDGLFPPYRQVIPKETGKIVTAKRHDIQAALKRISAMASERTRGVRFSISPKNLEISSKNPNFGQAREELSVNYKGESFEVGFNARYFLEALSVIEDEQVVLELGDDTAPCVIKSEFDRGFLHVIMPMRL